MDKEKTTSKKEDLDTKKALGFLLRKFCVPLLIVAGAVVWLLVAAVDGMMNEMESADSVSYSKAESESTSEMISAVSAAEAFASAGDTSSVTVFPMDINLAEKEQFMLVEGIGEKTADAIIAYRDEKGVITSIESLAEIDGIGDSTATLLKCYFFVSKDVYVPYTTTVTTTTAHTTSSKAATSRTSKTTTRRTSASKRTTTPRSEPEPDETPDTEPAADPETSAETEPAPQRVPVDINHATAQEISECLLLPIEKAEDIISVREQIQYFSNVAELYLVESLTPQDIADITDYVIILPL